MKRFRIISTVIAICLSLSSTTLGDQLTDCNKTLQLCHDYAKYLESGVLAQDELINFLKTDRETCYDKLAEQEPSVIPTWLWFAGGVLIGGVVVEAVR